MEWRFLPKRFASTSRFVVSSRVWSNMIPTRDCDILMTFPTNTEDSVLMWLLGRLRSRTPQLTVHVRHHSNTGVYGFYLTASYENMLKGAEKLAICKSLKPEYGGGSREFSFEDLNCFQGVEDSTQFFSSQERQSIVYHLLTNLRAISGDQLGKIKFDEGQSIVPFLISNGVVKQVLPLHCHDDLANLKKTWVQAFFESQPLDSICHYFGVQIAIYFAYLGHYTTALVLPATVGIIFWLLSGTSQTVDDICFVVFAFFNVLWATLYLEHWKRTCSEWAYQWGTLDTENELIVEPRTLYTGDLIQSPVTGKLIRHYPAWKRYLFFYCVSVPIMVVCLAVVVLTNLCIFHLQDWVNHKIAQEEFAFYFKYVPKVLLAICIGLLDDIYKRIARWLNNKENYRLEETYENNLIIKLILFQFVNSFLSLFYIAFYLQDMNRLQEQLAALLITRQVIGNIKEALVPFLFEKVKLLKIGYELTANMSPQSLEQQATLIREHLNEATSSNEEMLQEILKEQHRKSLSVPKFDESPDGLADSCEQDENKEDMDKNTMNVRYSGPTLTQAELEASMPKYDNTFEDYLEMFIQFGYVTLFSSAFPMAAVCAFLNNIIEIRSDAFKLCVTLQRPFGKRVQDIGAWQDALELMSVIAVIVNCALVGMSGLAHRIFPDWGTTERIIIIVILEHVILAFRILLAYIIPDVPHWVAEEKARLEYLRREALKRMEHENGHLRNSFSVAAEDVIFEKTMRCSSRPTNRVISKDAVSNASKSTPGLRHRTKMSTGKDTGQQTNAFHSIVNSTAPSRRQTIDQTETLFAPKINYSHRARTVSPARRDVGDTNCSIVASERRRGTFSHERLSPTLHGAQHHRNTLSDLFSSPVRQAKSTNSLAQDSGLYRKASVPSVVSCRTSSVSASRPLNVGGDSVTYRSIQNDLGYRDSLCASSSLHNSDVIHSRQYTMADMGGDQRVNRQESPSAEQLAELYRSMSKQSTV